MKGGKSVNSRAAVQKGMGIFSCSLLAAAVCFQVCGAANKRAPRGAWQKMIQERLDKNPAWQRAEELPPFDPKASAGFVADEREKQSQRNAAANLWRKMKAAHKAGAQRFTVPPRQYRFTNNRGLTLNGWRDFTISAYGACFWFERPLKQIAADPHGLNLVACRNVTIRGLSIDFDPPVYVQTTIVSVDPQRGEIIADIDPAWPAVSVPPGQFSVYAPDGKYVPQGTFRHKGAILVKDRRLRVVVDPQVIAANFDRDLLAVMGGRGAFGPGYYLTLNFRRGRSVGLVNCEGVTLEDISVYQSPGMGILERGGVGGNIFRRLRLARKPGTRRVHYGTADHFHSGNVAHGAQVIGCEFAHTSDDCVNLHGYFGYVWRAPSPTKMLVGTDNPLAARGTLTFYDWRRVTVQGEAKIAAVSPLEDAALIAQINAERKKLLIYASTAVKVVELDHPVTTSVGSLVDTHMNCSSGFLIKDCYFHDSRSRGMLLSGARDGAVENCLFDNILSGINVYMESWKYMEGPIPGNIAIRDCLLMNLGSPRPGGGIGVGLVPGGGAFVRRTRPIRNCRVSGNLVIDGQIAMLYTDGGEIRDNVLVEPLRYVRRSERYGLTRWLYGNPGYFPRSRVSAISVWSSGNVIVEGNTVYLSGRPLREGLADVGDYCDNVQLGKNELIRIDD